VAEDWKPLAWSGKQSVVLDLGWDAVRTAHHPDCPKRDPEDPTMRAGIPLAGVIEHTRGRHNIGAPRPRLCEHCLVEHDPTEADRSAATTWSTP
jgi:hypothetical protein